MKLVEKLQRILALVRLCSYAGDFTLALADLAASGNLSASSGFDALSTGHGIHKARVYAKMLLRDMVVTEVPGLRLRISCTFCDFRMCR